MNYPDPKTVPPIWEIGDVILDLYEVKEVFTGGGMGLVYRVHHRGWQMDLAVKSPRPEFFQSQQQIENFEREAETWVTLGLHPHIVSCYYVRRLGGIPRIFSEFIDGGTLADWIRTKKLYEGGKEKALERILDMAIQFAWGLQYAHKKGLVHQDVKPGNVLVSTDGSAQVSDFGLANARRESADSGTIAAHAGQSILVPGSGFMTPEYASPEQLRGEALSFKTDIWSWAVSLLEMLTGERTWLNGLAAPAVVEDLDNGRFDPDVLALLNSCFGSQSRPRLTSFDSVIKSLISYYTSRFGPYCRSEPCAAEMLAEVLNNKAISMADLGQTKKALELFNRAVDVERSNLDVAYNRHLLLWRNACIADNEFIDALTNIAKPALDAEKPVPQLGLANFQLGEYETAARQLSTAVSVASHGSIAEAYANQAKKRSRTRKHWLLGSASKKPVESIIISQDSATAFVLTEEIAHWDMESGACICMFEMPGDHVKSLHISGDPNVVLGVTEKSLVFWDVCTGKILNALPTPGRIISGFFSYEQGYALVEVAYDLPNGWFAFRLAIELLDLRSGAIIKRYDKQKYGVKLIGCSGTGKIIVSTSRITGIIPSDPMFYVWNMETMQVLTTFCNSTYGVRDVAVLPDLNRVLVGFGSGLAKSDHGRFLNPGSSGHLQIIDVHTGQSLSSFGQEFGRASCISVSKDGTLAATYSEIQESGSARVAIVLWSIPDEKALRVFHRAKYWGSEYVDIVRISPDAKYLIAGAKNGQTHVWRTSLQTDVPYLIAQPRDFKQSRAVAKEFQGLLEPAKQAISRENAGAAVAFLRRARQLAGFSEHPDVKRLWQLVGSKVPHTQVLAVSEILHYSPPVNVEIGYFTSIALAEKLNCAVAGCSEGEILLWNYVTDSLERILHHHERAVQALDVSERDHDVLIASGGDDPFLQLFYVKENRIVTLGRNDPNLEDGVSAHVYGDHGVDSIAFSPSASHVACGCKDGHDRWKDRQESESHALMLNVWALPGGHLSRLETLPHTTGISSVCFVSIQSKLHLLTGSNHGLELWEIDSGTTVAQFGHEFGEVERLCKSKTGELVASAHRKRDLSEPLPGNIQSIVVWNVRNQTLVHRFLLGGAAISGLCFTSDNRFLISLETNKTVRFWNLGNGNCCYHASIDADFVTVSDDGCKLACANGDQISIYEIEWDYNVEGENFPHSEKQ